MSKPGPRWTETDIQTLKALAQSYPTASIAKQLGRSVSALTYKAHELKLSLRVKRRYLQHQVPPSRPPEPGPAGVDLNE